LSIVLPSVLPMPGHILVVDDDADICDVPRDRLESYGYPVEVAVDGRAALLSLDKAVPRGLILDIQMPHIDGLEVLRQTRERHPLLPIIMITADLSRISEKVIQAAQEVLMKPIEAIKFEHAIRRLFGSPL
jgi:CheY-like chemotaxis protein